MRQQKYSTGMRNCVCSLRPSGGHGARLGVHVLVERLGVAALRRRSRRPVNHEHWLHLLSPHVIYDEHDEKNGAQQADHSAANYA